MLWTEASRAQEGKRKPWRASEHESIGHICHPGRRGCTFLPPRAWEGGRKDIHQEIAYCWLQGVEIFVSLTLFFLPVEVPLFSVAGGMGRVALGGGGGGGGEVANRLPLENCIDFSIVFEGSLYKNKTKPKLQYAKHWTFSKPLAEMSLFEHKVEWQNLKEKWVATRWK